MSTDVELADDSETSSLRSSASFTCHPSSAEEATAAVASKPRLQLPPRPPSTHRRTSSSPQGVPGDSPPHWLPSGPPGGSTPDTASASAPPSTVSAPSLWCRLPDVVSSGLLDSLSDDQRKLQEALFEVISSEGSYHSSLQLVQQHFQKPLLLLCQRSSPTPQDPSQCLIDETDYQDIFHNFDEVLKCSTAFLAELERVLHSNVLLAGICDVVHTHATWNFYPYKQYCAQKIHQDRKLKQLTKENVAFSALLSGLETSPDARGMTLAAFLHLPVQRVQRYPMLMASVLKRMEADHPERESCDDACQALTTLARHCDEDAARELQRVEAEANCSFDQDKITKGRRSWRRRGVRRHSADVGATKKDS